MTSEELGTLAEEARASVSRLLEAIGEAAAPADSRALAYAVAAGLSPQASYSIRDTARYLGVSLSSLYREREAGRLRVIKTDGTEARVACDEVDRWMRENTR